MATIDCAVVGDSGVIVAKTISYPVVVGNKIDDINAAKITAELKALILANSGLTLAQLRAEDLAKQANVTALQSSVVSIPTNPVLTTDTRLNNLDATVSSRMATFTYTAPDNTGISNIAAKLPSAGATIAGEGVIAKNLDQVTTDLSGVSTAIGDIASDVELIRKMTNGRWKIANNQMVFYDADNTTVVATYDLKDSLGNPTMSAPFERVKV